jgi:hypothetical protein
VSEYEVYFSMRNILLLQLLTLVVARDSACLVRQKLSRIWKSFTALLRSKKPAAGGKKGKFWEIDMTKFEP